MIRQSTCAASLLLALTLTPVMASAEITVDDAWARATPPGMDRGAGYLTVRNEGDKSVRLDGASVDVAETVEIHHSSDEDGQMHMEVVENGIAIPAGDSVTLKPKGYHLMLMGLDEPLKAGDEHELVLEFSDGDAVGTTLEVRSRNYDNDTPEHNH